MKSRCRSCGQRASARAVPSRAFIATIAWLAFSGGAVLAQTKETAAPSKEIAPPRATAKLGPTARTQGGARVTFSSLKDWNLKGENLSARGHNPLYFPLKPGFRYIMEYPNHPWGHLRIEVTVLEKTEKFDVPGIGKFECAVVQEEEFYAGVLDQRADNWFCIDKTTNSMY